MIKNRINNNFCAALLLILPMIGAGAIYMTKRYMWLDELFSYTIVGRPSFREMYAAAGEQIGSVPFYYVVAWLWTAVTGFSELSLRVFSMVGMISGVLLVYYGLRRHYDTIPSFIG